jgi:hypothetical protein
MNIETTIKNLCIKVCEKDSRFRIAFAEADSSTDPEPEANQFLKFEDSRVGRDFKLYALMEKTSSTQAAIGDFASVLMSIKSSSPEAFSAISEDVIGLKVIFDESIHQDWVDLWG